MTEKLFTINTEWKHLRYRNDAKFSETYGFSGNQGDVNLEGLLLTPAGVPSKTLLVFMHPASTLQLLPLPRRMVQAGHHVLCAGSRYQRNDTALIMENVLLDLGAYIRAARQEWGYEKIVLFGWSGGGSLAMFYQSQAQNPTITATPAGDPVNIKEAGLIPADAILSMAAHYSRARILAESIDPSVIDERDPDNRNPELDLYRPGYAERKEPLGAEFVARYRAAQLARIRRINTWVLEMLAELRRRNTAEMERCFVTHRTQADPRFVDKSIDPNDRRPLWTFMGHPETVNSGPVGLARFSMLRSWLSQWSIDHSRADSLTCGPDITVPFLAIEASADDAVPQPHTKMIFDVIGSADKTMKVVQGANHYFYNEPKYLEMGVALVRDWLGKRNFIDT